MQLFFVVLYLCLLLGIGFFSSKRTKKNRDYYIAGNNIKTPALTLSLLATILGSSAILGSINLASTQGWAASWFLLSASIGLFILVALAKYVRRFGKFTLPELLGDFYGEKAQKLASLIIPIAWIGIIAAQLIGASKILASITDIPYTFGVIISGIVIIIYTFIGGQKSIIKTDGLQAILLLVGLLLLAGFIYMNLDIPIADLTDREFPFNENFKVWDLLILLLTYASTFVVGPDIYSRLFCAKDEKTAQKSVFITAIVILIFALMLSFIGVSANAMYNGIDSQTAFSFLTLVNDLLPVWLSTILVTALLSAVMSSADTTLLTASTILSQPKKGKEYSIKKTRIFIVILGILSIFLALKVTSIISSLLLALTFFSGAFIIPVAAGLLSYRAKTSVVLTAMISGGIIALVGKLVIMFSDKSIVAYSLMIGAFIINASILFSPKVKQILNKY